MAAGLLCQGPLPPASWPGADSWLPAGLLACRPASGLAPLVPVWAAVAANRVMAKGGRLTAGIRRVARYSATTRPYRGEAGHRRGKVAVASNHPGQSPRARGPAIVRVPGRRTGDRLGEGRVSVDARGQGVRGVTEENSQIAAGPSPGVPRRGPTGWRPPNQARRSPVGKADRDRAAKDDWRQAQRSRAAAGRRRPPGRRIWALTGPDRGPAKTGRQPAAWPGNCQGPAGGTTTWSGRDHWCRRGQAGLPGRDRGPGRAVVTFYPR